jgi:hypothetical protein
MQMIMFFLIKGGSIGCFKMAAKYAPVALEEINAAFAEEAVQTPAPPVSCAAMVAEKMGASELHTIMAAGLAGGIGLCGGACGALGAAVWLSVMNRGDEESAKIDFADPRAAAVLDRFMKASDCEFVCAEVVGRKFEDIGDHAAYMREGGCAQIIEALAST